MQIRNSFDQETADKIIRSALWSLVSGLTAFVMSYVQSGDIKTSAVTGLLTMLAPLSANSVYQYKKGS